MPIKIAQLVRKKQIGAGIAPTLLEYMEKNSDRAFAYDDTELAKVFPRVKPSTIGWAMWQLYRKGFIQQIRAGRKVYFFNQM